MSVIILLIVFSMLIAFGFLAAFIWSIRDNQYEDIHTPSIRMLLDDEPETTSNDKTNNNL